MLAMQPYFLLMLALYFFLHLLYFLNVICQLDVPRAVEPLLTTVSQTH